MVLAQGIDGRYCEDDEFWRSVRRMNGARNPTAKYFALRCSPACFGLLRNPPGCRHRSTLPPAATPHVRFGGMASEGAGSRGGEAESMK